MLEITGLLGLGIVVHCDIALAAALVSGQMRILDAKIGAKVGRVVIVDLVELRDQASRFEVKADVPAWTRASAPVEFCAPGVDQAPFDAVLEPAFGGEAARGWRRIGASRGLRGNTQQSQPHRRLTGVEPRSRHQTVSLPQPVRA